jgi:hypothetical protein
MFEPWELPADSRRSASVRARQARGDKPVPVPVAGPAAQGCFENASEDRAASDCRRAGRSGASDRQAGNDPEKSASKKPVTWRLRTSAHRDARNSGCRAKAGAGRMSYKCRRQCLMLKSAVYPRDSNEKGRINGNPTFRNKRPATPSIRRAAHRPKPPGHPASRHKTPRSRNPTTTPRTPLVPRRLWTIIRTPLTGD